MTTTLQIRKMLDIELTGNEIAIVDIILSYIMEECDGCKDKFLFEDVNEVECNCAASTDLKVCKQDYLFCEECSIKNICYGCDGQYYCPNSVEDGYEMRECGDENCERVFCDGCMSEDMLFCSQCEDSFCCRGVRRYVDSGLEYYYVCDVCNRKENCEYFRPRHCH